MKNKVMIAILIILIIGVSGALFLITPYETWGTIEKIADPDAVLCIRLFAVISFVLNGLCCWVSKPKRKGIVAFTGVASIFVLYKLISTF